MIADIALLLSFITAAFAGAVGHEVAHWLVWRATGRQPRLDVWGLTVQARAGPQHTTAGDRVAAAAPYALGLACILVGLQRGLIPLALFGGAMVQIPSNVDVRTMRGQTEWAVESDTPA